MSLTQQAGSTRPSPASAVALGHGDLGQPWWTRSLVAAALLIVVYAGIVALADPRGTLGTDTGGKLATLAEMSAHDTWDPDIGYWAAPADPDTLAHPLYYTVRFEDRYVNVTTLPMLFAAKPLSDLGGVRLALALPMLGAIGAAFAARGLAARFGARFPDRAFWYVGLLSPIAIYALDLWEHTIGVALMGGAIVALVDLADDRRGALLAGLGAGLAFGAAATLRTEALLYGAACTGVALVLVARRRPGRAVVAGGAALAGVVVMLVANEMLERAVLGDPLRSGRAADTAASAGGDLSTRIGEGIRTSIGLNYSDLAVDALVGSVVFAALATAVVLAGRPRSAPRHLVEALAAAVVLYVVRFRTGLSFVSGMFAATPLAVAGFVGAGGAKRLRHRWLVATAVGCLPAVWAVQFVGGAGPQWGGRYVLASGWVLGVAGLVVLETMPRAVSRTFVGLALVVTVYGVAFAVDRTHDAARLADAIVAREEPLVVARVGHVFREAGAEYTRDRPWLTAVDAEAFAVVVDMIAVERPTSIAVITYPDDGTLVIPAYRVTGREPLAFFSERLEVRHYEPAGP